MQYTYEELVEIINRKFEEKAFVEEPFSLFEPLAYILGEGGKRLRPVLMLGAYNMYRDDIYRVMKPALGIEMFHNYTLIHDDLMDDADIRRNKPTVHKKWNKNVAILSGDAAAIVAYTLMTDCDDGELRLVIDNFNRMALDVCKGQQYDMEFESREEVSMEEYLKMICLKTSVLIAAALRHGGIIAGADAADCEILYELGINLGMAFQIQDDYLDIYGDVSQFGKFIGKDIVENKKTYLLIKTLEVASVEDVRRLRNLFETRDMDTEEKIEAVAGIYERYDCKRLAKEAIDDYLNKALAILANLKLPREKKSFFEDIVEKIRYRNK